MLIIKSDDKRLVSGIVYEVNKVDSQNDYCESAEDIWYGMETFALNGMVMKVQHAGRQARVVVVEQFQPSEDIRKDGVLIPAGAWWLTTKVLDDDLWAAIKAGEINSFSMGGSATVEE